MLEGEEAVVTMGCGVSWRVMSLEALRQLGEACRSIRARVIGEAVSDEAFARRIPAYPTCMVIARCAVIAGVCEMSVVASRHGDAVEFCVSLYDAGDHSVPVLVLVDEEIDEFARAAEEAFA